MSDSFWTVFGIVGVAGAFLLTYFLGTYFYTSLIHNTTYAKLKASKKALIGQRTNYEAFTGLSYKKSDTSFSFFSRPYCYCRFIIKDNGLLFKPFLAKDFGLLFKNIVSISISYEKRCWEFPQVITIISVGNVADKIVSMTKKDVLLLEELRRYYKGEIIGYDEIQ